jgi:hypothetical protein
MRPGAANIRQAAGGAASTVPRRAGCACTVSTTLGTGPSEKFYAAHIKNTLDAAAINVMRPRCHNHLLSPKIMTTINHQKSKRNRFRKTRRQDDGDQRNPALIQSCFRGRWPLLPSETLSGSSLRAACRAPYGRSQVDTD